MIVLLFFLERAVLTAGYESDLFINIEFLLLTPQKQLFLFSAKKNETSNGNVTPWQDPGSRMVRSFNAATLESDTLASGVSFL